MKYPTEPLFVAPEELKRGVYRTSKKETSELVGRGSFPHLRGDPPMSPLKRA